MDHLQTLTDRGGVCGFEGNTDFYGFGIRLGLYFQLFSTISVTLLGKESYSKYYRLSNIAMLLSIIIVVLKQSVNRSVMGVEVAFISWIISTTLMSVSTSKLDKFYVCVYVAIGCMYSVYMAWFYYHGLDLLPKSTCADEYEFFFSKVSLWHWYRTFNKVIFTIVCLLSALGLFFVIYSVICTPLAQPFFFPQFRTKDLTSNCSRAPR
jgi:predicted histidine transporter YuiF (NhaC family)